ncbi:ECF transporter S component [Caldisalinibacter kiritimatiensis]|uniref:Riboflavin transporter n=1 Tax=Caldisalinibacter kiritimatiensis TaxID=1304284 RepID=R1AUT8_9FIRM|nr:ECF transporter S component [Caldisalinibacter kiritimatiensis]EOD00402.1 Substrate-specific component RibU of riboflavin ECF transporter [Caldisalinibacter kiritimatiensis]
MLTLKERVTTKSLTKISILSVLAFLIMFIEVPLWFTPEFLKVDLSDIPALIGAFALGPLAGVAIEFVKNILHMTLKGTVTGGVGELANFIVGSVFVYTASILYYKRKTFKRAIIGMILGTIAMTIVASLANYFVLIPMYAKIFGAPIEYFVELSSKVNGFVVDFKSFILFGIAPFNLLKGIMVSAITIPLYKKISPILHK